MQEEKTYQRDVIELNLADLFWSVLRHWRSILLVMLAAAVLLGGYTFYKGYREVKNQGLVAQRKAVYEQALEKYQIEKESLEKKLDNLNAELDRQESDRSNAIMLLIDPYNVYAVRASYYVDAHYELSPELYYQNPNYTGVITNSYRAAVDRLAMGEVAATPENPKLTARNPVSGDEKKLITTAVDDGNGLLYVTVYGDTRERAEGLFSLVKQTLTEQEALLNQLIGEHELKTLSEESQVIVDTGFEELQAAFESKVAATTSAIETTTASLNALSAPANSVPTLRRALVQSVKKGIIGLVAGLFVMGFFYLLKVIFQNRVNSAEEVSRRYGRPVLGVMTSGGKKNCLDAFVAGKLGVPLKRSPEEAAKYIASNIDLYVKEADSLLLVGTGRTEKLEQLRDRLASLLSGVNVKVGGNVNSSAAAVKELSGKTAVLCVEEWGKASHREIAHELQAVRASGNENAGFVLVA